MLAAYSSFSSCRQYREDIERARAGAGEDAPQVDKLRVFYNHPEFIAANAARAFAESDRGLAGVPQEAGLVRWSFTSHSIPVSMAQDCDYAQQIEETCRLVALELGITPERWASVYQSRSGRPEDPWLGPDILEHLRDLKERGASDVLIHPIGFLSDHVEVLYDLDDERGLFADELGLAMVRSRTVGTQPRFGNDDAAHAGRGADRWGFADGQGLRGEVRSQPRCLPGAVLPCLLRCERLRIPTGFENWIRVNSTSWVSVLLYHSYTWPLEASRIKENSRPSRRRKRRRNHWVTLEAPETASTSIQEPFCKTSRYADPLALITKRSTVEPMTTGATDVKPNAAGTRVIGAHEPLE